jgi:glycosyltransferase involved in cell wall biosynthesis
MSFHICFVGKNFSMTNKSGDKESIWPIAEKLSEEGCKVTIVSYKSPTNEKNVKRGDVSVHFVASGSEFVSKEEFPVMALDQVAQLHETEHFDHVHSLDTPLKKFKKAFRKNQKNKKSGKKPSLSYGIQVSSIEQMFLLLGPTDDSLWSMIRSTLIYPIYFINKFFFKDYFILREAQGVLVSSPKQALSLERHYLYPPNWIFQIPLDSYVSDLIFRKKSEVLMEKYDIKPGTPILATATNMKKPNELFFLLDVFERVALAHPNAKFMIFGTGTYFQEIEKRVLLKALDSRVIFTKNISNANIPDYISLSDIFININYTTSGFGPTLMEAMAQEKIIIGSEFSPISSVIENGKNGFLIRPGEVQKCAHLIDQIFTGSIDRESIGKTAREDIKKILNRDKLTEKTLKAFKKINSRGFRLFSIPFFN